MTLVERAKMFPAPKLIEQFNFEKLSPRTKKEYINYLKKMNFTVFNQKNVDGFLRSNNNNVARAFISKLKDHLIESDYSFLTPEMKGEISQVKIKKIKGSKIEKERIVITREQVMKICNLFTVEKPKLMLLVSYYCALRSDELFNITLRNFDWDRWEGDEEKSGLLNIKGKRGKIRKIFVPYFLMERIKDFAFKEDLTFDESMFSLFDDRPNKSSYDKWWQILDTASKRAIGKHISSHVLRRSIATHLLEDGWDIREVQEHLGHKDISTTQLYVILSKKHLEDKYAKFVES